MTATGADSECFLVHDTTLNSFPSYLDIRIRPRIPFEGSTFIQLNCVTPKMVSDFVCWRRIVMIAMPRRVSKPPGTQHGIDNNCDGLLNDEMSQPCHC